MSIKSDKSMLCEKIKTGDQCEHLRQKYFVFIDPVPFCLGYGEKLETYDRFGKIIPVAMKCKQCREDAKKERANAKHNKFIHSR
jgi:hypothetical protein